MNIRTMLVGFNDKSQAQATSLLQGTEIEIRGVLSATDQMADLMKREKPDLLLVCSSQDRRTLLFCQQIYVLYPKCTMVLLSDTESDDLYRFALEAGIRSVIAPLTTADDLVSHIKEIYINENSRHYNFSENASQLTKTQIISVFGAKGGIGRTSLAVNLAIKFATAKKKTLFLDFDMQMGNSELFLGVESRNTVAELLQEQRSPTLDMMNDYLVMHPSGLKVLLAPKSPEYAETISGKNVEKILKMFLNYYDYIVVDSSVGFSEVNLAVFDMATSILFMTENDIAVLQNSKKALLLLKSLNQSDKIRLVMKESRINAISKEEVERVLDYKIGAVIRHDYKTAKTALNQGKPVSFGGLGSMLAKDYATVALLWEENFAVADKKGRGRKGLFSSRRRTKKVKNKTGR